MKCDEMASSAVKLFDDGFHCSQAVLSVCADLLEIDDPSQAIATVSPFGGGLASTGSVCGCLPGALAAFGLAMGKTTPDGRDGRDMWRLGYKMVKEFDRITMEYGGVNCSDISGVNWKSRDDVKAFRKNKDGRRDRCHMVLVETVKVMCRLIGDVSRKD
jgi:C_GCAxxG_C_C family probable redox protein